MTLNQLPLIPTPPMNNEELRLSEQLAQLHLSFIEQNHQTLAAQAAREQWTHEQYLGPVSYTHLTLPTKRIV